MLQAMAICPCMRACGGLLSHVSHMAQQLGSNDRLQERPTGHRDANSAEKFIPWRLFQEVPIRSRLDRVYNALVVIKGGEDNNAGMRPLLA